jgi:hypothetical protein
MAERSPSGGAAPATREELREQIAHTREELGRTVEELAAKTDVKARAREKAEDVRERAGERVSRLSAGVRGLPVPVMAAAGSAVVLGVGLLIARKVRRR